MPMSPFRHNPSSTRTYYGAGCLAQLASELKRAGCSRAVIFSGKTLARNEPGVATIKAALGDACAGNYDGVAEHSPVTAVKDAVEFLRSVNADAIIALGGGSAIVTARAAGIILGEGKDPSELCTVFEPGQPPKSPRIAAPKVPQFIVPTTPTTAYAKAGAAMATGEEGRRMALFDPKSRASAVFFEPTFFAATPVNLIRDSALDAFSGAVQGLESRSRQPIADALLLQGLRLIRRGLEEIDTDPDARANMMLAALLVGQGTDVTAGGMSSAIGHTVGARFGVANGLVNSVMLPYTVEYNAEVTGNQLRDAAEVLGADPAAHGGPAQAVAAALRSFYASLGLASRLRDLGVPEDALESIADAAALDWFYTQNPRKVSREDCIALLKAAW